MKTFATKANPTQLRIGMAGEIFGRNYRVAGWSMMATRGILTRYYWQEYHLVGPSGEQATLVHESADSRIQWQFFTRFEPESPLSAAEAKAKRPGDAINLDGTVTGITFKGISKVCTSEGQVPDGYWEGEEDNFFNAQGGNVEWVVNWRGEKVDFYRGTSVTHAEIRTAFHLGGPVSDMPGTSWAAELPASDASNRLKWIAIVLLLGVLLAGFWFWPVEPKAPRLVKATSVVLSLGTQIPLDGREFRIQSHSLVEIAQVERRYERHEYQLAAADGNTALLVQGVNPGGREWTLYQPFEPLIPLTPAQAAAKRVGDNLNLEGRDIKITELFRTRVLKYESLEAGDETAQHFYYALSGLAGYYAVMARWDERGILFYRGRSVKIQMGAGGSR